jgi:exopolysaccharide biosynthesis polyprenyl glycosylphosphotransferase
VDAATLLPGFALAGRRSMVAGWLLTILIFAWRGLYRSRLSISVLDHLPVLFLAPLVAGSLAVTHDLVRPAPIIRWDHTVAASLLAPVLVILGRSLAYAAIRAVRSRGYVAHPTLLLGAGIIGHGLAETLLARPQYGLRPVAFWDLAPLREESDLGLPVIQDPDLGRAIAQSQAKVILIAFGRSAESGMVDIVRTCDRMLCEIFVVPRLFELSQRIGGMDEVWGTPLMRLRRPAFRSKTWRLKRLVDVLVSAALLLPLAPVLAVCALAVRLEGGRGVIFRQERVGLDGRVFQLFKFRSMAPASAEESATRWNVADDSRIGPVGRCLRRTSLDELPQLFNVLRGDMTLVGPRPERPHFVDQFTGELPRYVARHRVPAGLTGWAQIHGLRGNTSMPERIRFDNYYIENWSLWLDVKILVMTIGAVFQAAE